MHHPKLQLLIHADEIASTAIQLSYPGVRLDRVIRVANSNYLFLDLHILPHTQPGSFEITFVKNNKTLHSYPYKLDAKPHRSDAQQGFDASDVLYLIYPDRFANGDPSNDLLPEMRDQVGRHSPNGRHGGDLQGIIDHAAYLQQLGVTTLWLNPVLEMDMPRDSYHGYATTDHYRIDPRLGSNELMKELVDQFHQREMKIVMDVVLNHCGSHHHIIEDLPFPDWLNQWPRYTGSSFRISAMSDPYAADADQAHMAAGWFDGSMPDLNQRNPLVLTYMTQHCLWWIAYAGLDGLRLDTQPFSFKEGVATWANQLRDEFPNINLVGEVWQYTASQTAYFQADTHNRDGYNSFMPSVTDFPLHEAIKRAFMEEEGWETGLSRLYILLGQDIAYADPNMLLTFADNHDATRFFSAIGEDVAAWKMAMTFLLTTRGIPCLYYGTELWMTGEKEKGDPDLRKDFPGGWAGDERNAFEAEGRTEAEREAFDFLQKLLNYRKNQPLLHTGKLTHYMPRDGVYVYFRAGASGKLMVIINKNEANSRLDLKRFEQDLRGFHVVENALTRENFSIKAPLPLAGKSAVIFELK